MSSPQTSTSASKRSPVARIVNVVAGLLLWGTLGFVLIKMWKTAESESSNAKPDSPKTTTVDTNSNTQPKNVIKTTIKIPPKRVQEFSLIDSNDQTVTNEDLLGKQWVVGFIFTRCAGPCPKVTNQMATLQDAFLPEEVRLVSLSVDPEFDQPDVLSRYAKQFRVNLDQWTFLTGEQAAIYTLIKQSFKMPVHEVTGPDRKPGYEVIHTTNVVHVNKDGFVIGKYNSLVDTDMERLRRAIQEEIDTAPDSEDESTVESDKTETTIEVEETAK